MGNVNNVVHIINLRNSKPGNSTTNKYNKDECSVLSNKNIPSKIDLENSKASVASSSVSSSLSKKVAKNTV